MLTQLHIRVTLKIGVTKPIFPNYQNKILITPYRDFNVKFIKVHQYSRVEYRVPALNMGVVGGRKG